jgi:hypothetical protein
MATTKIGKSEQRFFTLSFKLNIRAAAGEGRHLTCLPNSAVYKNGRRFSASILIVALQM